MPREPQTGHLLTRAARRYYMDQRGQTSIARELGISQASVSRLLKQAVEEGIVRISIHSPAGDWSDLEDTIRRQFNLKDVIVAEPHEGESIEECIGLAAATFIERTLADNEIVGLSSWSDTLLAMVKAMRPFRDAKNVTIAQILGGLGNPGAETHAYQLTSRFSALVQGNSRFLPSPGIATTLSAKRAYLQEPFAEEAVRLFDKITLALVGIGSMQPSKLISQSGNIFSHEELETLKKKGAVGDVCMRFFDTNGNPVRTRLDARVIGMELAQLKKVPRSIGVAGGLPKLEAIRASLRGGWINTLVTDSEVAKRLVR